MKPIRSIPIALLVCLLAAMTAAQSPLDTKTAGTPLPSGIGAADDPSVPVAQPRAPKTNVDGRSPGPIQTNVMFDIDGSTTWAVGQDYKMAFDATGAAFHPALGPAAPQSMPVSFRLDSIRAGARKARFAADVEPRRTGHRVTFDRGLVQEIYDVDLHGVEQSFTLAQPLAAGALELRIRATTTLAAVETDDGVAFTGPFGGMHYGLATVVDADGRASTLPPRIQGDCLVITVPETFLESARYPLTVDPGLATQLVYSTGDDAYDSDVAFETGMNHFLVVFTRTYSAVDHDVYAYFLGYTGVVQSGSFTIIDSSVLDWTHPRVAANRVATQFLVVGARGAAPARQIWGRTVESGLPPSSGAQFQISGAEGGDKHEPVVGGDPSTLSPTYYCVAWQRDYTATDEDIHARLVTSTGASFTGVLAISNLGSDRDQHPAISKSDGIGGSYSQFWQLVWQRQLGAQHDLVGARLSWDATVVTPPFPVNTTPIDSIEPSVTTLSDPTLGASQWLVTYEVVGAVSHVGYQLMQGQSFVTGSNNLALIEGSLDYDRHRPTATCTGATYTIAYSELWTPGSPDYDLHATTLNVIGGTVFGVSEANADVSTSFSIEAAPAIASKFDGGERGVETEIVFDWGSNPRGVGSARYLARAASGGLASLATGCGSLGLAMSGQLIIGQQLTISMPNAGVNPLIVIGAPIAPTPLCGSCLLGVDIVNSPIVINGATLSGTIPADGALVGVDFAIQGADFSGAACQFRVSDTAVIRIM